MVARMPSIKIESTEQVEFKVEDGRLQLRPRQGRIGDENRCMRLGEQKVKVNEKERRKKIREHTPAQDIVTYMITLNGPLCQFVDPLTS